MTGIHASLLMGSLMIVVAGVAVSADPPQNAEQRLVLPDTLYHYVPADLPDHFTAPDVALLDNTPRDNPITDAGATLGRVLFYDVQLSANNTIACATCHVQAAGFSDPRPTSIGFEGDHTRRNFNR